MNICDYLLPPDRVRAAPGRLALVTPTARVTYGELLERIDRSANAWRSLGLSAGDRVAFVMRDDPEMLSAYFGAIKAGLAAIALNNRLAAPDIALQVNMAQAAGLLVDPRFDAAVADLPAPADGGPRVLWGGPDGDWAAIVATQEAAFEAVECAPQDMAFWLFSSGTTGLPKAIVHSHKDGAGCPLLLREHYGRTGDDFVFCTSKLFFAYPMANAVMGPLHLGMSILLYPDWPDPAAVPEIVAQHRPTIVFMVPTLFRRILAEAAERMDLFEGVEMFVSAGERMPVSVFERWQAATGLPIHDAYGNSESHGIVIGNRFGAARAGVAGVLVDQSDARLGRPDSPPPRAGDSGELWVKHPSLSTGYWRDEERNRTSFDSGWFRTGDIFEIDEAGEYVHLGRSDNMTRVAGQWVSPAEVVDVANRSGLYDEAACVLVADADGFERLALFVVADGVEPATLDADLRAFLDGRLPRHKRPRWVRVVDEIPKTATGKVQVFRLRDAFQPDRP